MTLYRMTHFNQSWNHATGPIHGLLKCLLSIKFEWNFNSSSHPLMSISIRLIHTLENLELIYKFSKSEQKLSRTTTRLSSVTHSKPFFFEEQAAWRYISNLCIYFFYFFTAGVVFFFFSFSLSRFFANMRQFSAAAPSVLCGCSRKSRLVHSVIFFSFLAVIRVCGVVTYSIQQRSDHHRVEK